MKSSKKEKREDFKRLLKFFRRISKVLNEYNTGFDDIENYGLQCMFENNKKYDDFHYKCLKKSYNKVSKIFYKEFIDL